MSGAAGGARRRRPALVIAACLLAALTVLGACSTGNSPDNTRSSGVNGTPTGSDPADPSGGSVSPGDPQSNPQDGSALATITTTPNGTRVNPTAPVTVSATDGTLTSVTMHNGAGKQIPGELVDGGTSWHTTEVLGYGKTYTIEAKAVNGAGVPTTKTTEFTTLSPGNQTMPYINDLYGAGIRNGGTYGVAMVVNVVFDEPITDKANAERALQVTTTRTWTDRGTGSATRTRTGVLRTTTSRAPRWCTTPVATSRPTWFRAGRRC